MVFDKYLDSLFLTYYMYTYSLQNKKIDKQSQFTAEFTYDILSLQKTKLNPNVKLTSNRNF